MQKQLRIDWNRVEQAIFGKKEQDLDKFDVFERNSYCKWIGSRLAKVEISFASPTLLPSPHCSCPFHRAFPWISQPKRRSTRSLCHPKRHIRLCHELILGLRSDRTIRVEDHMPQLLERPSERPRTSKEVQRDVLF